MHRDRAVHVDRALGGAGRAAGEMKQRRVVGGGGLDRRVVVGAAIECQKFSVPSRHRRAGPLVSTTKMCRTDVS